MVVDMCGVSGEGHLSLPSTNVDGGSTEKAAEGRRTASCCKDMTAQLALRSKRTLHATKSETLQHYLSS